VGRSRSQTADPAAPLEIADVSDVELLNRLQVHAEDEGALAELYDRYASLVFGLSVRILKNPQDAEDLTQEVFLSLFQESGFDPARGRFRGYLVLFTRSRALDRLRRRRRTRALEHESDRAAFEFFESQEPSPLDQASSLENARAVSDALGKLSARQRRALELAYYRGMSQSEIAAELDQPLGTVKGLVRSGLQSLRRALGFLAR
jgi:RNA polymerase sigma-70 factor (ECF subfamily)